MIGEYLTVQEFAKAAGVSKQTIYKQMNSRLAPYVQTIKGQKRIAAKALYEFYDVVEQPNKSIAEKQLNSSFIVENSVENPTYNQLETTTERQQQAILEKRIDELEKLLRNQIEEDRQEKEFLKDQIKQKDKTIENLTENLKMAQQLAAADKKKLLEIEQKQQDIKQDILTRDQPEENINTVNSEINPAAKRGLDQDEYISEKQEESKGLKAFFKRLFN